MEGFSNYVEHLEKKSSGKLVFAKISIIAVSLLVVAVSFVAFTVVEILKPFVYALPLLWAFVGVFAYLLFGKTLVEYEYTVVSGYFQLDVIYSKKTRKRICELKCSDISVIAPVSEKNSQQRAEFEGKTVDASRSTSSEDRYYLMGIDSAKNNYLIYINADKKALDCFTAFNRRAVNRGEL